MNAINQEIEEVSNLIQQLNQTISLLKESKNVYCEDANILEEELIQTETQLELETKRYNDLLQLRDYQMNCEHEFVGDLIDITPDRSKMIRYCVHCLFSDEN